MIYFVGAGSGAPDLITVRGARLLSEADVIVYAGSLVNPALLDYKKDGCEVYNSAKMTLEEVIAVMAPAAKAGKTVVRLHTGDPCVYGAHREQMDELDRLGLAYEVCPGVSSFCGAAAALKAEYTLPNVSQSVILTRMEGRTPVPEKEQIESFAAHGATMVIFLSAGQLARLSERLIAGGYAPDTPAWCTRPPGRTKRSCGQRSQTSPKPVRERALPRPRSSRWAGSSAPSTSAPSCTTRPLRLNFVRQADEARKICILYSVRGTDCAKGGKTPAGFPV